MKADKLGDVTSLRSEQGNRPRRQDYQADWTYCDSLEEYANHLEALNAELMQTLREIAKPALGGKAQQYAAQAILAKAKP